MVNISQGFFDKGENISQLAYDSDSQLQFQGFAEPGSATSGNLWQIREFTYSSGNLITILWADGNQLFDNVWDDRAALSYS